MNTDVFPEIFSLTVLICLFQPIVSRVARNSSSWIFGWGMLLAHYIACAMGGFGEPWQAGANVVAFGSLPIAGLFFCMRPGTITKVPWQTCWIG